jgi:2-isopropylmalate synthase
MSKHNHDFAAILEQTFGFRLPPAMRQEFQQLIEIQAQQTGHAPSPEELNDIFCREYIHNTHPFELTTINFEKQFVNTPQEKLCCTAMVKKENENYEIKGCGNGTLNALLNAFKTHFGIEDLEILDYLQHGLTQGSSSLAASYIQDTNSAGKIIWGVGIDSDSTLSAVRALLSTINRSLR